MATSITLKDIKWVKMLRAASTMKNKRKDFYSTISNMVQASCLYAKTS